MILNSASLSHIHVHVDIIYTIYANEPEVYTCILSHSQY